MARRSFARGLDPSTLSTGFSSVRSSAGDLPQHPGADIHGCWTAMNVQPAAGLRFSSRLLLILPPCPCQFGENVGPIAPSRRHHSPRGTRPVPGVRGLRPPIGTGVDGLSAGDSGSIYLGFPTRIFPDVHSPSAAIGCGCSGRCTLAATVLPYLRRVPTCAAFLLPDRLDPRDTLPVAGRTLA